MLRKPGKGGREKEGERSNRKIVREMEDKDTKQKHQNPGGVMETVLHPAAATRPRGGAQGVQQ